jgi:hypothetical protein
VKIDLRKYRLELAIALASLVLYILVLLLPLKAKQFGDGDFHIETKAIASYLHGYTPYEDLSITKAPGPVLFYLLPYFLAGSQASDSNLWVAGIFWTAIITTVTLVVLFGAINDEFGRRVGLLFITLLLALPLHIYYSMGVLAESLAFLGVCWLIIGFLKQNQPKVFLVFFTLGLVSLILARPNTGLVSPLLGIAAVYCYWRGRDLKSKKIMWSITCAVCVIVIVFAIVKSLPNSRVTLKQEEYFSFVMLHGRFQFRTETFDWRFWDDKTRADSKDYQAWKKSIGTLNNKIQTDTSTIVQVYNEWIWNDLIHHPVMVAKQFFVRILYGNTLQVSSRLPSEFSVMHIRGATIFWIIHIALNIVNISFVILALYFVTTDKKWQDWWPLTLVVLALWLFHGVVYMEQRYLFPLRAIIIFFASNGIVKLLRLRFRPNA